MRACSASTMFSRTDSSATMPLCLRSSGQKPRPSRSASAGSSSFAGLPSTRISPESRASSANSSRASSVRPEPNKPARPEHFAGAQLDVHGLELAAARQVAARRARAARSPACGGACVGASLPPPPARGPPSRPPGRAHRACAQAYSPTNLPLRSTVMRSQISYTWSRKCVTNRIATPLSRNRRISANSACTSSASRLEVGSSRISTRASVATARATVASCCRAAGSAARELRHVELDAEAG